MGKDINNSIATNDHTAHWLILGLSVYKNVLTALHCDALSQAWHKQTHQNGKQPLCLVCVCVCLEFKDRAFPQQRANIL